MADLKPQCFDLLLERLAETDLVTLISEVCACEMSGAHTEQGCVYQPRTTIIEGLKDSMQEEKTAADWYERRAKVAESKGDQVTAKLYRHIREEEIAHYVEYEKRAEKVKPVRDIAGEIHERYRKEGGYEFSNEGINRMLADSRAGKWAKPK